MKKRSLTFLFCLLLIYSLLRPAASAQNSVQASISSQGSISYPSPSPSPSPSPTPNPQNLAVIPDDWDLTYGSGPQIIFLDAQVTHNGHPSIRLEPHTANDANTAREADGTWYNVMPGDHIVARCWMKTDTNGDTVPYHGARIGIDLYNQENGHNYLLYGLNSPDYPNTNDKEVLNYVTWGTSTWTQRTMDFIVPSDYFTQNLLTGGAIPPTQVRQIVMWVQALPTTAQGNAWFADAELYINP
jgi:hypothetical protein